MVVFSLVRAHCTTVPLTSRDADSTDSTRPTEDEPDAADVFDESDASWEASSFFTCKLPMTSQHLSHYPS